MGANRHAYSTQIPNAILDLGLSVYAVVLYIHLKSCEDERKYGEGLGNVPSMRELAIACGMSVGSVVKARRELVAAGVAEVVPGISPRLAERYLREKVGQTYAYGNDKYKQCEWCRGRSLVLHSHHFPASRAEGGQQTVSVCPNCHYEYHEMVGGSICLVDIENDEPRADCEPGPSESPEEAEQLSTA